MKPIILGSSSPRRKEIFGYFGLNFEIATPDFDEDSVEFDWNPETFAKEIATGKANSLKFNYPNEIIVTADTVVYQNGHVYGKPKNWDEAVGTLSQLSGKWHSVITAVTVVHEHEIYSEAEGTEVLFNKLNISQIEHYLQQTQWRDKAGGYGIQMAGGLIVKKINGCYFNVMGLPVNTLRKLLMKVGIDLWSYIG